MPIAWPARRVAVDYFFETQHFGNAAGYSRSDCAVAGILHCGVFIRARLQVEALQIGAAGRIGNL